METTTIVPRIPTVIVEVLISSDSSPPSFSLTSRKKLPSERESCISLDFLVNFTFVFSSKVTILVESIPTEALLAAPVCSDCPLLKRMFSMTRPDLPDSSSISTVPS